MDRQISRLRNGLRLDGKSEVVNAITLQSYFKDTNGNIFYCTGLTVPTADSVGFSKGSLFIKTDAADGTKGLYENQGTTLLSDFNVIGAITMTELPTQIYYNDTGRTTQTLKIHSHLNTSEIGAAEFKGEFINTTGTVEGVVSTWSYQPTGGTGSPTGVTASTNVLAIAPTFTVNAGNIYALTGEVQLQGTLNGATVNVAGVIGILSGNGANTEVLHMAGVQSAMSTGLVNPTTGTLSHFLANSTSTVVIDNLLCMQDSEYITNFASFNSAATDKCIEANSGTPAGAVSHMIRVIIGGVPAYIPAYAGKFS